MKKFLSLLLALTLVLSLVVVPARATGDTLQSGITIAGKDDAKIGDIVAFSVPATATVTPGSEASESSPGCHYRYTQILCMECYRRH